MAIDTNIYLIGMMGSGKSSLGHKLSKQLAIDFIDLDKRIEECEQKSISALFREDGQPYFRKAETEYLRQTKNACAVIATGGGAPCFHGNLAWMKQNGLTVYLQVDVATIVNRLQSNGTERPMLGDLEGPALTNYISSLLEERESFYKKADIIFDGSRPKAQEAEVVLAEQIDRLLHTPQ